MYPPGNITHDKQETGW